MGVGIRNMKVEGIAGVCESHYSIYDKILKGAAKTARHLGL
jgi:hypothetical protein